MVCGEALELEDCLGLGELEVGAAELEQVVQLAQVDVAEVEVAELHLADMGFPDIHLAAVKTSQVKTCYSDLADLGSPELCPAELHLPAVSFLESSIEADFGGDHFVQLTLCAIVLAQTDPPSCAIERAEGSLRQRFDTHRRIAYGIYNIHQHQDEKMQHGRKIVTYTSLPTGGV